MDASNPTAAAPSSPWDGFVTGQAPFDAIDVIRAKRDGATLTGEQIRWVIGAYTARQVPDEQMAALLMAVFFRGMDDGELAAWTQAMIDSGTRTE